MWSLVFQVTKIWLWKDLALFILQLVDLLKKKELWFIVMDES